MASPSPYTAGAFASREGFDRFLNSIQPRGVMYGGDDYSRSKREDQVINRTLQEYDRYWKYIPGSQKKLDWAMSIQVHPSWRDNYEGRRSHMLQNAPKWYQPY